MDEEVEVEEVDAVLAARVEVRTVMKSRSSWLRAGGEEAVVEEEPSLAVMMAEGWAEGEDSCRVGSRVRRRTD